MWLTLLSATWISAHNLCTFLLCCIFCCVSGSQDSTLLYSTDTYHSGRSQRTAMSQGQRKRKDTSFKGLDLFTNGLGVLLRTFLFYPLPLACGVNSSSPLCYLWNHKKLLPFSTCNSALVITSSLISLFCIRTSGSELLLAWKHTHFYLWSTSNNTRTQTYIYIYIYNHMYKHTNSLSRRRTKKHSFFFPKFLPIYSFLSLSLFLLFLPFFLSFFLWNRQ